jgi:hypothetical protein
MLRAMRRRPIVPQTITDNTRAHPECRSMDIYK